MGKWRYGVILDAGSSGTRVYVYRWLHNDVAREEASDEKLKRLPALKTEKDWTKKIHPGISSFGDNPNDVGPDHLRALFDHALEYVPEKEVPNTPLFLLATAGMRILPPLKRKAILQQVCDYARKTTKFQLPDCDLHVQVIPGETEGLYGWIAANYLLGGFDKPDEHNHGKGHHTYGFLDMGGASAQIAFAPNATEAEKHANDLTLLRLRSVGGQDEEYKVFVTTWLGFGVHQARERYVQALMDSSPGTFELPDPCLPSGLKLTTDGKSIASGSEEEKGLKPHLLGTGNFQECMRQAYPLLGKDKPCPDTPCLINGQHVPAIDFDINHFVGVSEYWHTTHEIFEMSHKDKAYDFKTYQQRVNEFCSQPWKDIQAGVEKQKWGKKVDETTALEVCFKASWLINVLHDGIGVPRVGIENLPNGYNGTKAVLAAAKHKGYLDPFKPVNKIDDVEVSWTLGKMVLYASSEVPPPSSQALAVGFGSNEPGIPKDFQHPGGSYHAYEATKDDGDRWHDPLSSENKRRIPGFVIFAAILFIILYFFFGRRRKGMAAQGRFTKPQSTSRRRFGGKFFNFARTPSYERVLEDGEAAAEFELGSADSYSDNDHSDSSEGSSRVGRTSGWATPHIQAGLADPGTPTYFDSPNLMSQGAGLGLGLMSRTESRERLALAGRRSRASSPTRKSPKMGTVKES